MARLSLEGLTKSYGGAPAVSDLSVEVEDGELLVLVGPSGSGKSTTLRLIAGLESLDRGTITLGARDITALAPAARDIAMVFQSYALFPHMSVAENLAFGLTARRRPKEEVRARVLEVASVLGLSEKVDRFPRQLSGGERQRVALGRAMVRQPDLFLFDEPLSNLDAQLRTRTRAEIARLQAKLGTTSVYVTHDQIEALSIGHRIGVLRDGTLQQLGTPREIYDRPSNLFVAGFMGSPPMNVFPARVVDGSTLSWAGGQVVVDARPGIANVLVGVRPEHVHLRGSRWSATAEPGEAVDATVTLVESLGDQVLLTLDVGGTEVVARAEPHFGARAGEGASIWLDRKHLHLFDPATEERIG